MFKYVTINDVILCRKSTLAFFPEKLLLFNSTCKHLKYFHICNCASAWSWYRTFFSDSNHCGRIIKISINKEEKWFTCLFTLSLFHRLLHFSIMYRLFNKRMLIIKLILKCSRMFLVTLMHQNRCFVTYLGIYSI